MPKGPQGQKRKADVIGNAVLIGRIATGKSLRPATHPARRQTAKGGLKGGKSRAAALSAEEREAIAKKAAQKRWSGK